MTNHPLRMGRVLLLAGILAAAATGTALFRRLHDTGRGRQPRHAGQRRHPGLGVRPRGGVRQQPQPRHGAGAYHDGERGRRPPRHRPERASRGPQHVDRRPGAADANERRRSPPAAGVRHQHPSPGDVLHGGVAQRRLGGILFQRGQGGYVPLRERDRAHRAGRDGPVRRGDRATREPAAGVSAFGDQPQYGVRQRSGPPLQRDRPVPPLRGERQYLRDDRLPDPDPPGREIFPDQRRAVQRDASPHRHRGGGNDDAAALPERGFADLRSDAPRHGDDAHRGGRQPPSVPGDARHPAVAPRQDA